jgi:peptide deformylase
MCEPTTDVTDVLRLLARDTCEVLYYELGIGLAAPQLGEEVRVIVVDTEWNEEGAERNPLIVLNPELTWKERQIVWNEGCLSVPGFTAGVERFERVVVRGRDLEGTEIVTKAEGLRAVCLQHEIDHLDGIHFIDRISRLKRSMYARRKKKAATRRAGRRCQESPRKRALTARGLLSGPARSERSSLYIQPARQPRYET